MPKKIQPISAEVVLHGQPSAALVAALKETGSHLTDVQLASAWRHAESARTTFVCASIAVGALLLAKKHALGHGKWLPWCQEFGGKLAAEATVKLATPLPISELVTPRSLRRYTFLAQHFLADLEQGGFAGETTDHRPAPPNVAVKDVLALDRLDTARRSAVFERIETFAAGRSLRTMLLDFRRAENAADQEEIEEENRRRRKKKDDAPEGQMDFFADMMKPLGEIDTLFDTQSFVERTDKKFWISVAEKLETQARRARELAKEVRS